VAACERENIQIATPSKCIICYMMTAKTQVRYILVHEEQLCSKAIANLHANECTVVFQRNR
jgi:hypothetical protein